VVVNPTSGGVDPDAPEEAARIIAGFGLEADVAAPPPERLHEALETAVRNNPDLVVVLAGDGTARAAASLCGPTGPLVAPLPGGTMNLRPHALYGVVGWREALIEALTRGVERPVGGGEVEGQYFYVAAILGAPARMARAREAARGRKLQLALVRARRALRGVFSSTVEFSLDGGPRERTEVLTLICPLVSKQIKEGPEMEAAAINLSQPQDVVRLGFRALAADILGPAVGDWRDDPAVSVGLCRTARVWSSGPIPATLDGEFVILRSGAVVGFRPDAFRALAPPPLEPEPRDPDGA
jgi:diacylglycerol kinase family enzyme